MAGQHHRCNEHELGQTPGDSEGQGGLVCRSPWGCKESDMPGQMHNSRCSEHHPSVTSPIFIGTPKLYMPDIPKYRTPLA